MKKTILALGVLGSLMSGVAVAKTSIMTAHVLPDEFESITCPVVGVRDKIVGMDLHYKIRGGVRNDSIETSSGMTNLNIASGVNRVIVDDEEYRSFFSSKSNTYGLSHFDDVSYAVPYTSELNIQAALMDYKDVKIKVDYNGVSRFRNTSLQIEGANYLMQNAEKSIFESVSIADFGSETKITGDFGFGNGLNQTIFIKPCPVTVKTDSLKFVFEAPVIDFSK